MKRYLISILLFLSFLLTGCSSYVDLDSYSELESQLEYLEDEYSILESECAELENRIDELMHDLAYYEELDIYYHELVTSLGLPTYEETLEE